MAELCKECFLKTWHPYVEDISSFEEDIVMSEDNEVCEGCGRFLPYVHHIGKELTCDEYDEAMKKLVKYYDEHCSHGEMYAINDDGTIGEKIGTCSILKGC